MLNILKKKIIRIQMLKIFIPTYSNSLDNLNITKQIIHSFQQSKKFLIFPPNNPFNDLNNS